MSAISGPVASPDPRTSSGGKWWGLTVVCLGTMMSFLNITTVVSVLSPVQRNLHTTSSELVWIASIYSLAVASVVLSAGTLGDLFGRRRIFAAGAVVLGAGSLVTFFARSPEVFIGAQALTGIGGAMVIPNALAIVTHSFTEAHERANAVAIWATVSGVGLAIGPVAAGALLKVTSYHSVFLINDAVAVLVLLLVRPFVAESRHPTRRLDPVGLVLAVIVVGALNYGVIQGGNDGYGDLKIIIAFAVTVVGALAFTLAELRSRSPMLEIALFRRASFTSANLAAFIVQCAFVGIAVAQVLWFEQVRGATILSTGLRLLPLMGVFVIFSTPAGRLAQRVGLKIPITLGLALIAAGSLLMVTQTPVSTNLTTELLEGVIGLGCALALPSTIAAAVISVPHSEGGMASASVNMFRQIGSTLGASITGTIITTGLASRLPGQLAGHGVPAAARPAIVHAVVAGESPAGAPAKLLGAIEQAAGNAFAASLHVAVFSFGAGAVVVLAGCLVFLASRPQAATAGAVAPGPVGASEREWAERLAAERAPDAEQAAFDELDELEELEGDQTIGADWAPAPSAAEATANGVATRTRPRTLRIGSRGSLVPAFTVSGSVAGTPVSFDASDSLAPAGDRIVDHHWEFGDGSSSHGPTPTDHHEFAAAGFYAVTLTITDALGQSASTSQTVPIAAPGSSNGHGRSGTSLPAVGRRGEQGLTADGAVMLELVEDSRGGEYHREVRIHLGEPAPAVTRPADR